MLKDQGPKAAAGTTAKARQLRRTMTLPEVQLWQQLRGKPFGLKFRRQHPAGPYVLDFYCIDARLAAEVDGRGHDDPGRAVRDLKRDAFFTDAGIETLRIAAADIMRDPAAAAEAIVTAARARLPLHHPAAPDGPPPRA